MVLISLKFVVCLNDSVEERAKGFIGVMRSSVDTNTRIWVLTSREDGLSETETGRIFFVFQVVPSLLVK